jgi:hypothetical protein
MLKSIEGVSGAAAVYSGVDVVAVLEGTSDEIDAVHAEILSRGAPIQNIEPFPVDLVIPGRSLGSHQAALRGSCGAIVRCETRIEEYSVDYSATILAQLPGVTRVYVNRERSEIVLEVLTSGKGPFDDAIMSSIQGQWSVVKSTRTLITIGGMSWWRDELRQPSGLLFVSLANHDLPFGTALSRRLHQDTGLTCWTYSDIPVATGSWPGAVDDVIRNAELHVFLLSAEALESAECQREFGKVEAIVAPEKICCLLLPGCEIAHLPVRYQVRQCLKANDFFAYPRLIEWIEHHLES